MINIEKLPTTQLRKVIQGSHIIYHKPNIINLGTEANEKLINQYMVSVNDVVIGIISQNPDKLKWGYMPIGLRCVVVEMPTLVELKRKFEQDMLVIFPKQSRILNQNGTIV